jgi:putative Mg2+ transporter-C (MgtC) family protein
VFRPAVALFTLSRVHGCGKLYQPPMGALSPRQRYGFAARLRRLAMNETIDVILRLGAAALAGALIGVNRDLANKPIGMRTLGLVALGAAIVSLAGIQVEGMAGNPDALSRVIQGIIQGVMAGISFIGAGVILRDREARRVEGLTTAATVWITAALGIACGLAAWRTVGIAVVIALLILVAGRWAEAAYAAATNGGGKTG